VSGTLRYQGLIFFGVVAFSHDRITAWTNQASCAIRLDQHGLEYQQLSCREGGNTGIADAAVMCKVSLHVLLLLLLLLLL